MSRYYWNNSSGVLETLQIECTDFFLIHSISNKNIIKYTKYLNKVQRTVKSPYTYRKLIQEQILH